MAGRLNICKENEEREHRNYIRLVRLLETQSAFLRLFFLRKRDMEILECQSDGSLDTKQILHDTGSYFDTSRASEKSAKKKKETWCLKNNLGCTQSILGNHDTAHSLFAEALKLGETLLTMNDSFVIKNNLALNLMISGKNREAESLLSELYEKLTSHEPGKESHDGQTSKTQSSTKCLTTNFSHAFFNESFSRKSSVDQKHFMNCMEFTTVTVITRNYARVLIKLENHNKAIEVLQGLLVLIKPKFDINSSLTISSKSLLITSLTQTGRMPEAIKLYLTIQPEISVIHRRLDNRRFEPGVPALIEDITKATVCLGKRTQARTLLEKTIDICGDVYGVDHSLTQGLVKTAYELFPPMRYVAHDGIAWKELQELPMHPIIFLFDTCRAGFPNVSGFQPSKKTSLGCLEGTESVVATTPDLLTAVLKNSFCTSIGLITTGDEQTAKDAIEVTVSPQSIKEFALTPSGSVYGVVCLCILLEACVYVQATSSVRLLCSALIDLLTYIKNADKNRTETTIEIYKDVYGLVSFYVSYREVPIGGKQTTMCTMITCGRQPKDDVMDKEVEKPLFKTTALENYSVIQGGPGTGKSFVGQKVLTLLRSSTLMDVNKLRQIDEVVVKNMSSIQHLTAMLLVEVALMNLTLPIFIPRMRIFGSLFDDEEFLRKEMEANSSDQVTEFFYHEYQRCLTCATKTAPALLAAALQHQLMRQVLAEEVHKSSKGYEMYLRGGGRLTLTTQEETLLLNLKVLRNNHFTSDVMFCEFKETCDDVIDKCSALFDGIVCNIEEEWKRVDPGAPQCVDVVETVEDKLTQALEKNVELMRETEYLQNKVLDLTDEYQQLQETIAVQSKDEEPQDNVTKHRDYWTTNQDGVTCNATPHSPLCSNEYEQTGSLSRDANIDDQESLKELGELEFECDKAKRDVQKYIHLPHEIASFKRRNALQQTQQLKGTASNVTPSSSECNPRVAPTPVPRKQHVDFSTSGKIMARNSDDKAPTPLPRKKLLDLNASRKIVERNDVTTINPAGSEDVFSRKAEKSHPKSDRRIVIDHHSLPKLTLSGESKDQASFLSSKKHNGKVGHNTTAYSQEDKLPFEKPEYTLPTPSKAASEPYPQRWYDLAFVNIPHCSKRFQDKITREPDLCADGPLREYCNPEVRMPRTKYHKHVEEVCCDGPRTRSCFVPATGDDDNDNDDGDESGISRRYGGGYSLVKDHADRSHNSNSTSTNDGVVGGSEGEVSKNNCGERSGDVTGNENVASTKVGVDDKNDDDDDSSCDATSRSMNDYDKSDHDNDSYGGGGCGDSSGGNHKGGSSGGGGRGDSSGGDGVDGHYNNGGGSRCSGHNSSGGAGDGTNGHGKGSSNADADLNVACTHGSGSHIHNDNYNDKTLITQGLPLENVNNSNWNFPQSTTTRRSDESSMYKTRNDEPRTEAPDEKIVTDGLPWSSRFTGDDSAPSERRSYDFDKTNVDSFSENTVERSFKDEPTDGWEMSNDQHPLQMNIIISNSRRSLPEKSDEEMSYEELDLMKMKPSILGTQEDIPGNSTDFLHREGMKDADSLEQNSYIYKHNQESYDNVDGSGTHTTISPSDNDDLTDRFTTTLGFHDRLRHYHEKREYLSLPDQRNYPRLLVGSEGFPGLSQHDQKQKSIAAHTIYTTNLETEEDYLENTNSGDSSSYLSEEADQYDANRPLGLNPLFVSKHSINPYRYGLGTLAHLKYASLPCAPTRTPNCSICNATGKYSFSPHASKPVTQSLTRSDRSRTSNNRPITDDYDIKAPAIYNTGKSNFNDKVSNQDLKVHSRIDGQFSLPLHAPTLINSYDDEHAKGWSSDDLLFAPTTVTSNPNSDGKLTGFKHFQPSSNDSSLASAEYASCTSEPEDDTEDITCSSSSSTGPTTALAMSSNTTSSTTLNLPEIKSADASIDPLLIDNKRLSLTETSTAPIVCKKPPISLPHEMTAPNITVPSTFPFIEQKPLSSMAANSTVEVKPPTPALGSHTVDVTNSNVLPSSASLNYHLIGKTNSDTLIESNSADFKSLETILENKTLHEGKNPVGTVGMSLKSQVVSSDSGTSDVKESHILSRKIETSSKTPSAAFVALNKVDSSDSATSDVKESQILSINDRTSSNTSNNDSLAQDKVVSSDSTHLVPTRLSRDPSREMQDSMVTGKEHTNAQSKSDRSFITSAKPEASSIQMKEDIIAADIPSKSEKPNSSTSESEHLLTNVAELSTTKCELVTSDTASSKGVENRSKGIESLASSSARGTSSSLSTKDEILSSQEDKSEAHSNPTPAQSEAVQVCSNGESLSTNENVGCVSLPPNNELSSSGTEAFKALASLPSKSTEPISKAVSNLRTSSESAVAWSSESAVSSSDGGATSPSSYSAFNTLGNEASNDSDIKSLEQTVSRYTETFSNLVVDSFYEMDHELRKARKAVRELRLKKEMEEIEKMLEKRKKRELEENNDKPRPASLPVQESNDAKVSCSHFKRGCDTLFPCCKKFYQCHRCHNSSKLCEVTDSKASDATLLRCRTCMTIQEITPTSSSCTHCKRKLSEYFCGICKHFTADDKKPYHCEPCGICRVHRDNSFHCDVCNVCLNKKLQGKHKCRPDSGHDECCICLEDAFGGCQVLPCSHKVHRDCAVLMVKNGVRKCPICRAPIYQD